VVEKQVFDYRPVALWTLDLDKMSEELEGTLSRSVEDRLIRLEFELIKAMLQEFWSRFKDIHDLQTPPMLPKFSLQACYFCW